MEAHSAVETGPFPEGQTSPEGKKDDGRGTWRNKLEFVLSLLGFTIGYGNIWRFPYLCYKHGGAVFLIPYFIIMFLAGFPLFFMEISIGQYIGLGSAILFKKMAPILSGAGWGMVMNCILAAIYFNIIISWCLHYIVASFSTVLPWSHCANDYNSLECYSEAAALVCKKDSLFFYNNTCLTVTQYCGLAELDSLNVTHCHHPTEGSIAASSVIPKISPSEDFFKNRILGVTGKSWDDMGSLQWEMVGYLALSWIFVAASLINGIKSLGKVVYFTATFPYIILIVLLVRGITLEGAYQGIEFYIMKPNFTKLMEVEVWCDAAMQIFYTSGVCFGCLITLSSYNKFDNNCMRQAVFNCIVNCCTSIFTGFVIFSVLGFLAHELGVRVEDVTSSGSGLIFVVYPAALALLPFPALWSVLFFFMAINIGLSTQFSMVETILTSFFDQFENMRSKKPIVVVVICFILFLFGLTFCLEGGIFMFELFFWYSAGFNVIAIAVIEVVGIQFIYGYKKFLKNIQEMGITIPFSVRCYFKVTWLFTTPLSMAIIGFSSVYYFAPAYWGDYVFPNRIQALGWCISASSIAFILLGMIYSCFKAKKLKDIFKPLPDFCPASQREIFCTETCIEPGEMFRYTYYNEGFEGGNNFHSKVAIN